MKSIKNEWKMHLKTVRDASLSAFSTKKQRQERRQVEAHKEGRVEERIAKGKIKRRRGGIIAINSRIVIRAGADQDKTSP